MVHWFSKSFTLTLALALALAPAALAAQDDPVTDATTEAVVSAEETVVEGEAPTPGLRIIDARGVELDSFMWEWRIVAVLADSANDPAFLLQMRDIEARADYLYERDVVVLTDTDPAARSDLRQRLRARGFMLAIIEKDGAIAQRRPAPRDAREIAAIIDRFPLRRQEMLERLPGR